MYGCVFCIPYIVFSGLIHWHLCLGSEEPEHLSRKIPSGLSQFSRFPFALQVSIECRQLALLGQTLNFSRTLSWNKYMFHFFPTEYMQCLLQCPANYRKRGEAIALFFYGKKILPRSRRTCLFLLFVYCSPESFLVSSLHQLTQLPQNGLSLA